ncbi:glutamate--tRNA ligase [Tunturiibacter gelidoferens]|uniref:Glutamyl-tRNA synthetase n=1 Tax=Tunturiibacter gelidiferens TaxID=3069689 RepID=A0ACC5NUA7_9BACT|nr:glutamate--tRNA ligase [Edaphobacter lichenicola]MBB5338125.1 glutamyl-tRNA synthetase [Edaphobacter lichenicola]
MTNSTSTTEAPIRVRIAPSPTGDPHVGTAYIGLINYLYARQRNGKFVLRIEDTDRARFVATSEQEIFNSLRWLGLTWDEGPDLGGPYGPYRQSERTEIYREHVELLLANGTAYRSFETPEELEDLRQRQIASKLPPRYDGAHRELSQAQIDAYLAEGRPYTVRLKVPAGDPAFTEFRDELRGVIRFEHSNVDDQVLMKSDGFPTYHLANVVDDHLMQITDVIRAEEWISSTPKHVLLYKAFGWQIPRFWHMPLLRNLDKSKISKRKNPVSLIYYRQAGFLPEAMINFLGLMGGGMPAPTESTPTQPATKSSETDIFILPDMVARFDVKNIRLGGPVFDLTKLKWLNGEYIRALTPEKFYAALRETILSDAYLQQIAPLVQTRIETLGEFGNLTHFLFADDIMPPAEVFVPKKRTPEETLAFAAEQLTVLEATDWTHEALEPALKKLGEEKQWSVKENFMLLRAILTGSTMSPPLLESMVVFGKSRTLDRVRRFLETQKKLANTKK